MIVRVEEKSIMESMNYIPNRYGIEMIPVVESENGNWIVNLESLMSFCEDNGIEDYGIGLTKLSQANSINSNDISFYVEEVSVLLSNKLQRIVHGLLECGVDVRLKPIDKNDPLCGFDDLNEAVSSFVIPGTYYQNDKIDWEDDKQTFDLLIRDLKKQNAPQSLIDKAHKLHDQGYNSAQIRGLHAENKYFHPEGEVGNAYLYENPHNQRKQERAGAKYERRERRMKGIGSILSGKENREDEARFNANKERTLRYLKHHAKLMDPERSTFQISHNDNPDNDTKEDIKNIKVRYNSHIDAEDKDLPNRLKKLQDMVEKEQFPKTWLAKKIAWLRSLYREFMMRHTVFKHGQKADPLPISGAIKNVAAMILRLIDKLAQKLQNAVN